MLENGQHKGNGFSCAGLGQAKDIFAFKNGGNCLLLDWGRAGVARVANTRLDAGVKLKLGKNSLKLLKADLFQHKAASWGLFFCDLLII